MANIYVLLDIVSLTLTSRPPGCWDAAQSPFFGPERERAENENIFEMAVEDADRALAEGCKSEGNSLFAKNSFADAIEKYSEAIEHDPGNAVITHQISHTDTSSSQILVDTHPIVISLNKMSNFLLR